MTLSGDYYLHMIRNRNIWDRKINNYKDRDIDGSELEEKKILQGGELEYEV